MTYRLTRTLVAAAALTVATGAAAGDTGAAAHALLRGIYSYDAGFPLNARTVGTFAHGGIQFERIVFDSFHDGRVPGLFAAPDAGKGPFPVVLLLHGISGNKRQWLGDAFTSGGEVTAGLLAQGFAVLALDAQYHGERALYNDYVDPSDMIFKRGWGVRYANAMTQTVVDYRRAIDYLGSRADVDASRVGVLGYSMGAHMAFILSAVDERIGATVACVVPYMGDMPMAPTAFTRDLGDRPLLMMMGRQDRYYTVEQAQTLFDAIPGMAKQLEWFDSGHSLPSAYAAQAAAWMGEHL